MSAASGKIELCYTDEQGQKYLAIICDPQPIDAVAAVSSAPVLLIKVKDKNRVMKSIAMMDPSSYGYAADNEFADYRNKSKDVLFLGNRADPTIFYRHLAYALSQAQDGDSISIYYVSRKAIFSPRIFQQVSFKDEGIKQYFIGFANQYPKCKYSFHELRVSSDYFAVTGTDDFVNLRQSVGNGPSKKWQLGEKKIFQDTKGRMTYLCTKPLPLADDELSASPRG